MLSSHCLLRLPGTQTEVQPPGTGSELMVSTGECVHTHDHMNTMPIARSTSITNYY